MPRILTDNGVLFWMLLCLVGAAKPTIGFHQTPSITIRPILSIAPRLGRSSLNPQSLTPLGSTSSPEATTSDIMDDEKPNETDETVEPTPMQPTTSSSSSSSSCSNSVRSVDFQAYANGYKTVFSELPFAECQPSFGTVPADLKGTYFRSGPAMFSAGSIPPPKTSIIQPRDGPPVPDGQNPQRMVQHPFEADGGVLGVTFAGNGTTPTARFRYVRTVAFTNERRKGQRLYKGMDSTRELGPTIGEGLGNDLHTPLFKHHLQPGLNKNRKNTANTRAVYWGKRLLSLWEGGQPYKLDSLALSTEGRSQLGGILEEQDPFGSKLVVDPVTNRALMYKVVQDAKTSKLTVYEFNDKFRLVDDRNNGGDDDEEQGKVMVNLPGLAMISDMAVTTNFAIFVQPAVTTGMQFLIVKEPGKVVTVEKAPAMLHLVPRLNNGGFGQKEPLSFAIPFDGVIEADLQFINAYEDDNKIVLDAIRSNGSTAKSSSVGASQWPWASSQEAYQSRAASRSLWRYTVDTSRGAVTKDRLSDTQCFFGSVKPGDSTQKHNHIFMAVGGLDIDTAPPQGIARFDVETKLMETWMPKEYEFCGEPMFAPKEGGDEDGYLLTVLFNGKTEQSELVVLESTNIAAGPLCRIPIGIGIPHGLHGCFTNAEEATWAFDEIQRRAKLADKMESRGNRWNEVKSDFSGLGLRFDDMEEYFGDSFLS